MDAVQTQPIAANGDLILKEAPPKGALSSEPLLAEAIAATAAKTTPVQIVLIVLGVIAFLHFARPVVLPVFLACGAASLCTQRRVWAASRTRVGMRFVEKRQSPEERPNIGQG